jgi:carboxylesterase type B
MFDMNPPVVNISSHLQLSRGIVDKFVSFIATGDPNTFEVPFIPEWPAYSLDAPSNMVLNATESDNKINVRVEADTYREKGLALWSKYDIELEFGSSWRPEGQEKI